MEGLKSKFMHLKQRQQRPSEFHIKSDVEHVCQCCGHHYVGNYCPCCSQQCDMGRITWRSVRRGVMDIWGLGTRSLLYSVWQLMWRPGYFIGEYISGKRQVSFPPVKMLFIMAIIYSFIFYWLIPNVFHIQLEEPIDKETMEAMPFIVWNKEHSSWVGLFTSVIFILPTWLLFRYAPRYPKHTIPEGFFIQVLMTVLVIVLDTVSQLICGKNGINCACLLVALMVIYYYVSYRQLFGYGVWGTLWRQLFMWTSTLFLMVGALFLVQGIVIRVPEFNTMEQVGFQTGWAAIMFASAAIILAIGYVLNRIATRYQAKRANSGA